MFQSRIRESIDSQQTTAGGLAGTFQVDIEPGDPINDPAVVPLVDALVGLSRSSDHVPYVNLHLSEDWRTAQIPGVAGQADKIAELATRTGVVVIGGAAPIWAYLAALCCALQAREDVRVFFYDPRQPERLVEIPIQPGRGPAAFPDDTLRVSWRSEGERAILQFEITTPDKFLPTIAAQNLAGAPVPPPAPGGDVGLSGAGPTWLYGTYARWLIARGAGGVASWDGRLREFVRVWGG